jgi:hypothetical protein
MRCSHIAVLSFAALSLTPLASAPATQAASVYSYNEGAPKAHHARHKAAFVPRAATAQVPEAGDSSCHLEVYDSFGVVPGRVHRLTTMCGPQ